MTAAAPMRIQRRRTRGWKMPENTVSVTRPGKWGNPFVVHHPNGPPALRKPIEPALAVRSFRRMVEKEGGWFPVPLPWPRGHIPAQLTTVEDVHRELRGKNLACWCALCPAHRDGKPLGTDCPDCAPCHADYLLEISNRYVCD